jgi:hypothetical protein
MIYYHILLSTWFPGISKPSIAITKKWNSYQDAHGTPYNSPSPSPSTPENTEYKYAAKAFSCIIIINKLFLSPVKLPKLPLA